MLQPERPVQQCSRPFDPVESSEPPPKVGNEKFWTDERACQVTVDFLRDRGADIWASISMMLSQYPNRLESDDLRAEPLDRTLIEQLSSPGLTA
jgi:hypothetical protein